MHESLFIDPAGFNLGLLCAFSKLRLSYDIILRKNDIFGLVICHYDFDHLCYQSFVVVHYLRFVLFFVSILVSFFNRKCWCDPTHIASHQNCICYKSTPHHKKIKIIKTNKDSGLKLKFNDIENQNRNKQIYMVKKIISLIFIHHMIQLCAVFSKSRWIISLKTELWNKFLFWII